MAKEKERPTIPPYVPYRTFRNFLDGLNPVPSVIDSAVLKTMGGALKSQLLSSLRYLKLVDSNNMTQPALKTLAAAKGEDRKKELNKILTGAYPFLFPPDAGAFSLSEGTFPQFLGKFQKEGASGDTVRRCGKFFLDAAKEAGIIVSPYIQAEPITKTKNDGGKPARARSAPKTKSSQEYEEPPRDTIPPSKWYSNLKPALDLLPTNFDKNGKAHWQEPDRERFFTLVTAIVDAYAIADAKD